MRQIRKKPDFSQENGNYWVSSGKRKTKKDARGKHPFSI